MTTRLLARQLARHLERCQTALLYTQIHAGHIRCYSKGLAGTQSIVFVDHHQSYLGRRRYLQTWSNLSRRDLASLEDHLVTAVGNQVKDPVLQTDLRSLGWIQKRLVISDDGAIGMCLRLPTLLHPSLEQLKQQVHDAATEILKQIAPDHGIEPANVVLNVTATASQPFPVVARRVDEHSEIISKLGPGLAHVAHFLAVYSCKGGVGKSTVAVNLAYELARMGGRIGLLDVDVYGPSLPVLVRPDDLSVRRSPLGRGMVLPLEHKNVKLLSLGFVSPQSGVPGSGPNGGAAVIRGPMASRVVTQLLKGTDWGELDVLVLDLPPGTGDVQLGVCQDLELSGAIAVTTPSKLAATDARKGIEMFTSLGVPTLAAVENMSYFTCEGGTKHYPFGKGIERLPGAGEDLDFKSSNIFHLPISTITNEGNDNGIPICVSRPEEAHEELSVFGQLASAVSKELLLVQHGRSRSDNGGLDDFCIVTFEGRDEHFDVATTYLSVDSAQEGFTVRLFSETGATQVAIKAAELRSRHPKTGEKIDSDVESNMEQEPAPSTGMVHRHHHHRGASQPRLFPAKIDKKGKYGYAVEWADGATIIYSMLCIAKAAGGTLKR